MCLSLSLFLCPCCFHRGINLWIVVQALLHPIFSEHIVCVYVCVCVLMVVERSLCFRPYKYERAVGVNRVRTAAHPYHPHPLQGKELHCNHAQNSMVLGNPWTTASREDCQTFKHCPGAIPLCNTVYNKNLPSNREADLYLGFMRHLMFFFFGVINLQDTKALSAGFFGCAHSQFLSGSWSETSLQKTAWKQKQRFEFEKINS